MLSSLPGSPNGMNWRKSKVVNYFVLMVPSIPRWYFYARVEFFYSIKVDMVQN
uniref:Uncharacterized protein n=1 Tax=Arundo donax TaxID=35708 RepID=A0A0A9H8I5_ARUDO